MELKVWVEHLDDDTCLVSAAGEIDLYTAPEFERHLLDVTKNGATSLIVDLGACTFMDSTALALLIEANRRLRSARPLVLISDDRNIRKVFEVTGFDRLFTMCCSRAEALDRVPRA